MRTAHILQFLQQLQDHNNKAWMDINRASYQEARNTLLEIAQKVIPEIGKLDPDIAPLRPASCIFRINRDIRFSKEKNPYKTNMGLYLSRDGKNGGYAGYYLHLEPKNKSFLAGGLYQPTPEALKKVRQEIDYNGENLQNILAEELLSKLFGKLQGESLQRPPKGYDSDHPYIEWLKLKSFIVMQPLTDVAVKQTNFIEHILKSFITLMPFNKFFNTALEPTESA